MIRASLVIAAAVAMCPIASAQDCPPGAATQATIANGTPFRVLGLHPEDAYYNTSYAQIIGVDATSTAELTNNGGCWYGGPANTVGGESYYFYKIALVIDTPAGGMTAEAAPTPSCPSDAIGTTPTLGTTYTVLGIHPDDAYAGSPTVSVGETVIFNDDVTIRDGCWISGPATSASGADLYFFKVALSTGSTGGRVIRSCPAAATTGAIPSGSQVRFLGIHEDDAYSNDAGAFAIGDIMTTTGAMNQNDACWYGGPTQTTDGSTQYFYKAAFEVVASTGTGGGASNKDAIGGNQSIADQLRGLSPDDSLDANVQGILALNYDRNASGTIDSMSEVNRIPCDVLTALNVPYQARWGTSVRVSLGFKDNLIWVGSSIGFSESMRSVADRQFVRCGIQ